MKSPISRKFLSLIFPMLLLLVMGGSFTSIQAQSLDTLAEEGVKLRIEQQLLNHLKRTAQLAPDEQQQRTRTWQQEDRDFKQRYNKLSKDEKQYVSRQIENQYAITFPPLQQKWAAEAQQLKEEARSLTAQRNQELEADAQVAAKIQTDRTFRQRQLDSGKLSAQEFAPADADDMAKIKAFQDKYSGYGGTWVNSFNKRFQALAAPLIQERDLQERLADTTSAVGVDAHRAADLTLVIKHNERRRLASALTTAQENQASAPLKTEFDTIKARYAVTGAMAPSARDFNQRVENLVSQGLREKMSDWDKAAREEYAALRAQTTVAPIPEPARAVATGAVATIASGSRSQPAPYRPPVNSMPYRSGSVAPKMIIPGIVLVLILLFVFRKVLRVFLSPVATYNDLVTLRNTVQNAWAQIDVQLKRRHDLISNYVEIVKGYAKHERGTLEEVAKARSRAAGATTMAERSDAENALASTMKSLYAVVESYPELKANQNFIALQHNLTETENILAGKREAYNNTVLTYNNRVQRFPTNLFAKVFRFKVRDFFELKSETEREAPKASI